MLAALEQEAPEGMSWNEPEGGYFLWLDLSDDVDTTKLLEEAKQEGVTFVAGPDFMIEGGANSLRLSFAPVPADQIPEGVERIARALERLRSSAAAA
jgi:DNA-binding transcriptional MocR family regulator